MTQWRKRKRWATFVFFFALPCSCWSDGTGRNDHMLGKQSGPHCQLVSWSLCPLYSLDSASRSRVHWCPWPAKSHRGPWSKRHRWTEMILPVQRSIIESSIFVEIGSGTLPAIKGRTRTKTDQERRISTIQPPRCGGPNHMIKMSSVKQNQDHLFLIGLTLVFRSLIQFQMIQQILCSISPQNNHFGPNIRPSIHPSKWFLEQIGFYPCLSCHHITTAKCLRQHQSVDISISVRAIDGDKHCFGYRCDAVSAMRKSFISPAKWRKRPGNEKRSFSIDRTRGWVSVRHQISWGNSGEIQSKQDHVLQMEGVCVFYH